MTGGTIVEWGWRTGTGVLLCILEPMDHGWRTVFGVELEDCGWRTVCGVGLRGLV